MHINMKRLLIIHLMLAIFSTSLFAESPQLKSVTMTLEPMTSSMQRLDANGNICGLVKVILPSPNVSFEGNLIGETDYKTSEYWCYLSPNTKFLKVKYAGLEPLMIDFTDFFVNGIQGKKIYEVTILLPHRVQSTGTPIRLNIKTQKDYFNAWYSDECKIRSALVGKPDVDIYVNLKNGEYDSHVKVEYSNFKDCLLADVHKGDVITIIPNKNTYATKSVTVVDSVISKKHLDFTIPRLGVNKVGLFIDEKTGLPIKNVHVDFYNLKRTGYKPTEYLYGSSESDSIGRFVIKNCFSNYIYNVRVSGQGYKFCSFDVIADTTQLIYKLTPKILKVHIHDGKKTIEGVKLVCKNLYNDTYYTNSSGDVEIIGPLDKTFTISHPDYETIIVTREWDPDMIIKMKKGDPNTIKEAFYDTHKDKLIYKLNQD